MVGLACTPAPSVKSYRHWNTSQKEKMSNRDRTKELMTNGLSPIQVEALSVVQKWVESKKTVCPKGEIFKALIVKDYGESAIRKAIAALVREGYIRRSVSSGNRTFFVLLKWL